MRQGFALSVIAVAGLLHAQDGQTVAKPGWPCVPGRPVDPAYLEVGESTGGQLFLFQKNEVAPGRAGTDRRQQAGRILRIDQPEAGPWRVRLVGRGLFVLSVLAKADTALTAVAFSVNRGAVNGGEPIPRMKSPVFGVRQDVEVRLTGEVSDLKLQLVDAAGDPISDVAALEQTADGVYLASPTTPQAKRFRVLVTGARPSAWPFERMYPVLFQARMPK